MGVRNNNDAVDFEVYPARYALTYTCRLTVRGRMSRSTLDALTAALHKVENVAVIVTIPYR